MRARGFLLPNVPLKHQRRIGAAETETIRHHGVELGTILALADDRHVSELRIELVDMGR